MGPAVVGSKTTLTVSDAFAASVRGRVGAGEKWNWLASSPGVDGSSMTCTLVIVRLAPEVFLITTCFTDPGVPPTTSLVSMRPGLIFTPGSTGLSSVILPVSPDWPNSET